ncbi:hypothetical protein Tco_0743679 [Tanacetum coccineum]
MDREGDVNIDWPRNAEEHAAPPPAAEAEPKEEAAQVGPTREAKVNGSLVGKGQPHIVNGKLEQGGSVAPLFARDTKTMLGGFAYDKEIVKIREGDVNIDWPRNAEEHVAPPPAAEAEPKEEAAQVGPTREAKVNGSLVGKGQPHIVNGKLEQGGSVAPLFARDTKTMLGGFAYDKEIVKIRKNPFVVQTWNATVDFVLGRIEAKAHVDEEICSSGK